MNLKDALARVQPDRTYSLTEIAREGLVPFIKSYHTLYKKVLEDKTLPKTKRLIDATILGEGKGRSIHISGERLRAYLKAHSAQIA